MATTEDYENVYVFEKGQIGHLKNPLKISEKEE
jgi:hypothetical protein